MRALTAKARAAESVESRTKAPIQGGGEGGGGGQQNGNCNFGTAFFPYSPLLVLFGTY